MYTAFPPACVMDTCKYMCIVNNPEKVALYIYSLEFLKEGRRETVDYLQFSQS